MLALAADQLVIEFREDPSLRTEVRALLGFIALRRDRREHADALLAAAKDDRSEVLSSGAAAALALLEADVAFYRGDSESSEPLYRQALAGMLGNSLRHANWRIYIRNQLINVMRLHGREAEARSLIPALTRDLESYPVRAENKAATYTFMALVEDDPQRALALHRHSYEILAAHLGPLEATVIRRLANVAGATLAAGDPAAALQGYAEAMRRVSERGELESDYFVVPQGVYGRLLAAHGRWEDALPWLQRAVRLMAQTRGTDTPLYLYVLGDLLFWQIEREPSTSLLAELDDWLQRCEKLIGVLHPRVRQAWLLRISLLRRLGQLDEAYAQWQAQRSRDWTVSPQQALVEAQWQAMGGALLLDLERTDEACRRLAGLEHTKLPGGPLVEGHAAALDLALCAVRSTPHAASTYLQARQQLAVAAGADNWRLAQRPDQAAALLAE
jgi:tetratricopeptide (TPR) repeat protein